MARSPAKRTAAFLLLVVAAILTVGFVFLLYAESANTDAPLVEEVPATAIVVAIVLGIIVIALLLMLLIRSWDERTEKAESGEVFFVPEDAKADRPAGAQTSFVAGEITVYDLRKVPPTKGSWGAPENQGNQAPFYFPRSVEGGVYVNDYIQVAPGRTLKLRTLMGGPYDPAFAFEVAPRRKAEPAAEQRAAQSLLAAATGASRQKLVLEEAAPEPVLAPTELYYDYPGDNHDIEDLEGIGQVYGERLRKLGVHTTARLTYEDTTTLAERMELPRRTVEQWKHMAELVKVNGIGPQYAEALVRAGIEGIAELKRRSPAKIAEQVNAYLDTLDTNVLGVKITEKRVEGWQDKARPMRRIRLQVPAQ